MVFKKFRDLLRNFYFLFFISFLIWMTIIDSNGFINRFRLSEKLDELRTEKEFYIQEIDIETIDKEKFESDEEILEKYAREEYLMKKESEDIFYVIEE